MIFAHQKYWKCFQTDLHSNSSYKPVSMYSYDDEPLSVFPTRDCYPPQDISKIDEFSVLEHLISGKNHVMLFVFYNLILKKFNLYL